MSKISDKLDFKTLQSVAGLRRIDDDFLSYLEQRDNSLSAALLTYRESAEQPGPLEISRLLLAAAVHLDAFLADRFGIGAETERLRRQTLSQGLIARFKSEFVLRRGRRYRGQTERSFSELNYWLDQQLGDTAAADRELATAKFAARLLQDPEANAASVDRLTEWCIRVQQDVEGQALIEDWVSFSLPQPVNPGHLVDLHHVPGDDLERLEGNVTKFRQRDGFTLTDPRMPLRKVMDHVHYCVYCHNQEGDFCSKGFPEKKREPQLGLKVNPLGVVLTGCPLEEKISEMHALKRDGHAIAALAIAMVDNAMIPATGHRICNDCMKACIYQKQDPVDIPQIETRVLTDVLSLPWGVEIYDLLTRWNPLRNRQYIMRSYNGRRVLVVGMGPAGFTMAHHLTMEGCAVVGIDGLKIEPLPESLLAEPVREFEALCESLDERIMTGFGGVAEYGITVRWDKNFLKLIYLALARRNTFQVFGGVRFGGTVNVKDAWRLGFDHVCMANGAGLPRVINMGNSLARGMRQANDFLMALQLTGAAKADSIANLQIRLPAVVVGGGLTAIDTATEVQAYYIKQVEKILHRYEQLAVALGEPAIRAGLDPESGEILDEFLAHGHAVRAERERAAAARQQPDFVRLIRDWGGVTIVYRRSINESPAYLRNHEEIIKAMEEGICYLEGMEPVRAELDDYGHVSTLVCRLREKQDGRWLARGKELRLPARAILVAAGTFPNIIYESEHPGTFEIEENHFLPHVVHKHNHQPVRVAEHCKAPEFGPFTSYEMDRHRVSFIGDAHPVFHGSVVKAIASASRSYPEVMTALTQLEPHSAEDGAYLAFRESIDAQLSARVDTLNDDHPAVVEMWVRAPMAARNFRPGQFFRLQTFETYSAKVTDTRLQIPLQTVSGAGVDGDKVRLLLLRWGANAKLAARLKRGDPIVLMGPTGAPVHLEENKTVLVVAGTWGAAVMLDLGRAMRARGTRVLLFAAYPDCGQLYFKEELEQAADQIVWTTASGAPIAATRPQDVSLQGSDVIDLIERYGRGELDHGPRIPLREVDEVLVMGSTGLLKAFQRAVRTRFAGVFRDDARFVGTVGSPMQCMLKGVCGQCLQWQIDPDTGERTRAVFSCSMQDQPLMWIDLDNLAARQGQNRLQEHLTNLWVDHVLSREH